MENKEQAKGIDMSQATEMVSKDKVYLRRDVAKVNVPPEFKGKFLRYDAEKEVVFYSKPKPLSEEQRAKNEAMRKKVTAERQAERQAERIAFNKFKEQLRAKKIEISKVVRKEYAQAFKEMRSPNQALIEQKKKAEDKYDAVIVCKNIKQAEEALAKLN